MAAWRYEISLVLFNLSKRNFVSPRGHVINILYQEAPASIYVCVYTICCYIIHNSTVYHNDRKMVSRLC